VKKLLLLACVAVALLIGARIATQARMPDVSTLKEGDVIFQKSRSPQSQALKLATGSDYTHCGILLRHDNTLQVLEASNVVKWTPLEKWIKRGIDGHYVIMRLKQNTPLPPDAVERMRESVGLYAGKPYDTLFQWSDDKIYCSELIWKLYQRCANIELGQLRHFQDYNLNNEKVRALIRARYGRDLPADENVIAPSDIMKCGLLETVAKN